MRIAINGLGRVGRALLRQAVLSEDLEVVAVNDLADPHMLAALLRRDTTYGPFPVDVEAGDDFLLIAGQKVPWSDAKTPADLPWASYAVDVAVECTGKFRTYETAGEHLEAGARKVVISAPGKGVDATIVMGINDDQYDPKHHDVVSNASCTTNCVAPMVSVLHRAFGLQQGFMTTVHAYTGDQNLLDGPHKDLRRARSAAVNIIPTTTGAARAVGLVLPELEGKLDGVALRVPVVDGSLVDLAVLLDREVTVDEVNAVFEAASLSDELGGRLRYETGPLVSADVIGESASCVFDSLLTQASGRFVKVFGWYDNEWGYVCRLAELVRRVGEPVSGAIG
jgi:glyceraldehyde 3-phosphate dehydrogenase